jgi:catechol 2,3-dioxygenase-like lactoylglutathione lyase family enzyme
MRPMSRPRLTFDHVSISVDDIDAGRHFYGDLLGLEPAPRPDFRFPGAWFRVGPLAIHLTTGGTTRGATAPLRPNDPHFALAVDGNLDAFLDELRSHGVEVFELHDSPAAERQTFIKDPWGNVVELCVNFPAISPSAVQEQT